MSYQIKNVVGLHVRDYLFAVQAFKNKLSQQLARETKQHLVLCNSFPKSGTHLLYQILYTIPGLEQWDDIISVQALCGLMNTTDHLRWKLASAPNHSIVRSHFMHCDEILEILEGFNIKRLFIYRDLRDVAISQARYFPKVQRHFLCDFYRSLETDDQRLMASIRGIPLGTPFSSNISQPDIGTDFQRWQGWVNDPMTLAIRFEDLVGARGSGSEDKRIEVVRQILTFLNVDMSDAEIESKFSSDAMNPKDSPTFRTGGKGNIGGWKTKFNPAHKDEFKKVAGQLLIDLGYEKDLTW